MRLSRRPERLLCPGTIGHWVTIAGPSILVLPCWKSPWKWIAVVSFPRLLTTLILMVSPAFAIIDGHGHCPLMPTKGLGVPSGDAETQPTFQLYVLSTGFGGAGGLAVFGKATADNACNAKQRSVVICIMRYSDSKECGWKNDTTDQPCQRMRRFENERRGKYWRGKHCDNAYYMVIPRRKTIILFLSHWATRDRKTTCGETQQFTEVEPAFVLSSRGMRNIAITRHTLQIIVHYLVHFHQLLSLGRCHCDLVSCRDSEILCILKTKTIQCLINEASTNLGTVKKLLLDSFYDDEV